MIAIFACLLAAPLAAAQATVLPAPADTDRVVEAWLRKNAIPVRHVEAGNGFADLRPLKRVLKDVTIVGLGDATHGTRESFQFNHRMLEFLAKEMGFNTLVLESSHAGCQPINEYILTGAGDPAAVLTGQGYVVWDTEEFAAMVEWLRAYNRKAPDRKRVTLRCIDFMSNALARKAVLRHLRDRAPDRVPAAEGLFQNLAAIEGRWPRQITDQDKKALEGALPPLDDLIGHLTGSADESVLRHAQVIRQWVAVNATSKGRPEYMTENLEYVLGHERPGAKFVLWAHSTHVRMSEGKTHRLGHVLKKKYGDRYYALGYDFNRGSYQTRIARPGEPVGDLKEATALPAPAGSYTSYLARTGVGDMIVDLRPAARNPIVAQWFQSVRTVRSTGWAYEDPSEIDADRTLGKDFDGIIFLEKTTATRPTPGALEKVKRREAF